MVTIYKLITDAKGSYEEDKDPQVLLGRHPDKSMVDITSREDTPEVKLDYSLDEKRKVALKNEWVDAFDLLDDILKDLRAQGIILPTDTLREQIKTNNPKSS